MKKKLYLLLIPVLMLAGCTKTFEEQYDSIYRIGPDGGQYCNMPVNYEIAGESGRLSLNVLYSGSWTATLDDTVNWAFLSRGSGTGISWLRLYYTSNNGVGQRTAVITLTCDNGESAEITVTQEGKQ